MKYSEKMLKFLNGRTVALSNIGCPEDGTDLHDIGGGVAECENGHRIQL